MPVKPYIAAALLASPLAVAAKGAKMSMMHPRVNENAPQPFFWDRSQAAGGISSAEAGQTTMHMMGAPVLSSSAAKHLPTADFLTPPQAAVVLAMGNAHLPHMPLMSAMMRDQPTVAVSDANDANGLAGSLAERIFSGKQALQMTPYTACISGVREVQESELCTNAHDSMTWDGARFSAQGERLSSSSIDSFEPVMSAFRSTGGDIHFDAASQEWTVMPAGKQAVSFGPEFGFLFDELRALAHLPSLAASTSTSAKASSPASPELMYLTLSGLVGMDKTKLPAALPLADAVIADSLKRLSSKYGDSVAAQVLMVDDFAPSATARRLAGVTPTPAPTADGSQLSMWEICNYQICLWVAIALILALLGAVCGMVNMDVQPDSLLYAKFQADLSSKNE